MVIKIGIVGVVGTVVKSVVVKYPGGDANGVGVDVHATGLKVCGVDDPLFVVRVLFAPFVVTSGVALEVVDAGLFRHGFLEAVLIFLVRKLAPLPELDLALALELEVVVT